MKKILILGASGMAGHVLYTYLKENTDFQIIGTTNATYLNEHCISLDIFNQDAVKQLIIEIKPSIIVNCIGSLIKESKTSPDKTIYCNAFFPHALKKYADEIGAKLIHLSTDCVFSGKTGQYREDSIKDATDVYGLSKSLGEIDGDNHLTIRTSIIGPEIKQHGEGLFHWFMQQSGTISGYKSNFWSGVTTPELAKFIAWQINHPLTGLVHLTNGVPISKYDLLNKINAIYGKGVSIRDDKDYVCDKSLSVSNKMSYEVPSYETMLTEQKDFMLNHENFYAHYNA